MDLTTRYLGLTWVQPCRRLGLSGVGLARRGVSGGRRWRRRGGALLAVFEEQVRAQRSPTCSSPRCGEESFGEARDYFPRRGPRSGTRARRRTCATWSGTAAAVDIPVIASLNGSTPGGWTSIASSLQSAGAAALELNIYAVPGDEASPARRSSSGT
ncbi:MAG: hypothetical protein R2734_09945 [Nocardioides sp.]